MLPIDGLRRVARHGQYGGLQARKRFVHRAAVLVGSAAETFNAGLRAYYFAFAALAWFFSPLVMILSTVLVVAILYSREFRSEVLAVLRG